MSTSIYKFQLIKPSESHLTKVWLIKTRSGCDVSPILKDMLQFVNGRSFMEYWREKKDKLFYLLFGRVFKKNLWGEVNQIKYSYKQTVKNKTMASQRVLNLLGVSFIFTDVCRKTFTFRLIPGEPPSRPNILSSSTFTQAVIKNPFPVGGQGKLLLIGSWTGAIFHGDLLKPCWIWSGPEDVSSAVESWGRLYQQSPENRLS